MLAIDERITLHAVENGIILTKDHYSEAEGRFVATKCFVYQDMDVLLEDLATALKHKSGVNDLNGH